MQQLEEGHERVDGYAARHHARADDFDTSSTTSKPVPPDFAKAQIRLTRFASGLEKPVALAPRHGTSTLYVANQVGDIRAIAGGKLLPARVLDLRGQVSGGNEQGLLGLTFSPDGSHLYVDFTDTTGDTHVQEFAMNGDVADTGSRRELLFVKQPFSNHNGGEVAFGPDGMLYIGLGDGGSGGDPMNNGQNNRQLLGKILRINPKATATGAYSVPADNPFVSNRQNRPEIWQWGCATRGASRSIAPPAISGSATSARTPTKRSTSRRQEQAASTSGGASARDSTSSKGRGRPVRSTR